MIKSYLQFILERFEKYTTELSIQQTAEQIKIHCKEFNFNDVNIDRVVGKLSGDCYKIDANYERKSANTSNGYTLFINNSEKWKDFPKRKVVCSLEESYFSGNYQGLSDNSDGRFRVVPFDGSKWGICLEYDIWHSFPYLMEKMRVRPDELNEFIVTLHFIVVGSNIDDDEFTMFKYGLEQIEDEITKFSYSDYKTTGQQAAKTALQDVYFNNWAFEYLKKRIKDGEKLYDIIDDLLDPYKNGFKVMTYKDLTQFVNQDQNEIWTDSDVFLLSRSSGEDEVRIRVPFSGHPSKKI